MRRLRVAKLAVTLPLVGCKPTAAPASQVDMSPDPGVKARPLGIDCRREDGPARPLTQAEYSLWYGGLSKGDHISLYEDRADRQEKFLARDPAPIELAESLTRSSLNHLEVYEWHAAAACVFEIAETFDGSDLEAHWARVERHLPLAFERAQEATRLDAVDEELVGRAGCVLVVAAVSLGRLEDASAASERLDDDQTCAPWALLVLADALDARGVHAEADALYQRVMVIHPFDPRPSASTCQVAPWDPGKAVRGLRGPPDPYSQKCSWDRYVRYRLVWSALQQGTIDEARAIELLQVIAVELHPEWDDGARLLADAIERDIERWR